MTVEKTTRERLAEAFAPGEVKFFPKAVKDGMGLALPYADARAYQEHLDAVVGPGGWETSFVVLDLTSKAVECRLRALVDGDWVTRADVGYPNDAKDADDAAQEPLKAAYSDAFKRACTQLGVGRFLYNVELVKNWLPVEVDARGRFKKWTEKPQLKGSRGSVAQRKEPPASNRQDVGSNPTGPSPEPTAAPEPYVDQLQDCSKNGQLNLTTFMSRMKLRQLSTADIARVAPHPSGREGAMGVAEWLTANPERTYMDLLDLAEEAAGRPSRVASGGR